MFKLIFRFISFYVYTIPDKGFKECTNAKHYAYILYYETPLTGLAVLDFRFMLSD